MTPKSILPWYLKLPAKIALSRLPISRATWQRLDLFRAGGMDCDHYAREVFCGHLRACGLRSLHGLTVLELGPGNGLLTAKYATELGASHVWLIDSECLLSANNTESTVRTTYLTNGLQSLRQIRHRSIDFVFSNAVLEHVRLHELQPTITELSRIIKVTGVASHQIDFRDHLQNALNNLRFSERIWESEFMASSGFYTNRVDWSAMREMFQKSGFVITRESLTHWESLPTQQSKMASPFNSFPPERLATMGAFVVMRPAASRLAVPNVE